MMIVVPTRGRPHVVQEMTSAFWGTRTGIAELCFAIDATDPEVEAYQKQLYGRPSWVSSIIGPSTNMVEALRGATWQIVKREEAIGFMGDDHRPRTYGWDAYFDGAIKRRHMVYGNDLLQGPMLPTHIVMPAKMIELLHGICPLTLTHLYVDNYWKTLGTSAGCIEYMGEVVIEHMHPVAGKAEWDDGYKRVNDGAMYERDARAFAHYLEAGMMDNDVRVIGNWVASGS